MADLNYSHLPRDSRGVFRSQKLPTMRGQEIVLPSQLDQPDGLSHWMHSLHDPKKLIVLDLFCGAGGMSMGFKDAGFFVAAGVDKEKWSVATHGYNFLSKGVYLDITTVTDPQRFIEELGLPRVDIIIGGPPCQGFSRIGRGKLRSIELEDHYNEVLNNLYIEFVRFVLSLRPMAFVMENVPDLALYQGGELLRRIKDAFAGYTVEDRILDAVHAGVPQRRRRLFIQGNRLGLKIRWPKLHVAQKFTTVREAIADLPVRNPPSLDEALPYVQSPDQLTAYQREMRRRVPPDQQHVVFDHIIRQVREDDRVIFTMLDQGGKYRDLPPELQRYRQDIFDDKYWRLVYDQPAWTVTAHIRKDAYRYIHPEQCRTLSIREFARLQSFPDHFRFAGPRTERLRQIGNAVPPLLARQIATPLFHQMVMKRYWERLASSNEQPAEDPQRELTHGAI